MVFRDTFSSELFQYFRSTHGRGGPAQRAPKVVDPWGPVPDGGSKVPFWRFIRSCQNPIGRAKPKNWNLWLCHIKQRSGKNEQNLSFFFIHKDLSKSIREGIDQKLQTMAFPYKIKGWKKICPKFTLLGEVCWPFWRSTIKSFFPEVRPHWFFEIYHF